MKDRVTLTLDHDLLARVDARIDGRSVKNRSHAVELLVRVALGSDTPHLAVILAGGDPAATLAIVKGKSVLEHNVRLCARERIPHVIILAGTHAQRIRDALAHITIDGTRIEVLAEKEPLGTAGALRAISDRIRSPFLVLNGDELKDVPFDRLARAHAQEDASVTIALTTVEDPSGYGVAALEGTRILRFIEKPSHATSQLISAGAYLINPDVLARIPHGKRVSLEHDLFPMLAADGTLHGYPFSGQWFDASTPAGLARAKGEWREHEKEQ